jgi:hypothetical protein
MTTGSVSLNDSLAGGLRLWKSRSGGGIGPVWTTDTHHGV